MPQIYLFIYRRVSYESQTFRNLVFQCSFSIRPDQPKSQRDINKLYGGSLPGRTLSTQILERLGEYKSSLSRNELGEPAEELLVRAR